MNTNPLFGGAWGMWDHDISLMAGYSMTVVMRKTERRAAEAQAEIREMAISARRSIGQRVRHAKKAIKQARAGQ